MAKNRDKANKAITKNTHSTVLYYFLQPIRDVRTISVLELESRKQLTLIGFLK